MSVETYQRLARGQLASGLGASAWDLLDKPATGRAYPSRSKADIDAALASTAPSSPPATCWWSSWMRGSWNWP